MAKGDDGSAPQSMNSGLPASGQGISGYGMDSIMPTLALLQRQNPQMFQGQAAQSAPPSQEGGMSSMNPMMGMGQFQQMLNPGFNFNTPISAPPTRNTFGQNIQSPFAGFGGVQGQNQNRTNPNPGSIQGYAEPRI